MLKFEGTRKQQGQVTAAVRSRDLLKIEILTLGNILKGGLAIEARSFGTQPQPGEKQLSIRIGKISSKSLFTNVSFNPQCLTTFKPGNNSLQNNEWVLFLQTEHAYKPC